MTTDGSHFPKYSYRFDDIILLEQYLKKEIKGQDKVIEDFTSVLKSNIIRTEEKPIFFILSGPSGVGKNLLVAKFASFMKDINKGGFDVTQIDLSNYYVNELSSLYGTTSGFSGSDQPPLMYSLAENIYNSGDDYGNTILFFDEVDKLSKNTSTIDIYSDFFQNIMSTLSQRNQAFKGSFSEMKCASIDIINTVIFISGNYINDNRIEDFEDHIGFTNKEDSIKNKKEYYNSQKVTKEKLLDFFKSKLPISVYNRINANPLSILQFNEITEDILYEIFKKEYNSLIEKIEEEMDTYDGFTEKFKEYSKPKKVYFKHMKDNIDLDNGARAIANYVNNTIKLDIINDVIIPIKEKIYSEMLQIIEKKEILSKN